MPPEDIRILLTGLQPPILRRLSRLCRRAGFRHLSSVPLGELRSPELPYDLVLVSTTTEDCRTVLEHVSALSGLPLVFVCPLDTAEQYAEHISRLAPLGVLLEPLTARHLRTLLPFLYQRSQRFHAALAESRWLWDILSSIGDGIIITDTDGHVQFLNPTAERLTGWTAAEARNRPLEEIFPIVNEETRQAVENPVRRVLQEGTIVGLANHTLLRSRTGEEIAIDDSGAPIRDGTGRIWGAVLVFRDVTELRRQQSRNRQALELRERLLQLLYGVLELRSPEEILATAVNSLSALIPLDLACFHVLEHEHLVPRWSTASPAVATLTSSPIPLQRSLLGAILQRGEPSVINDAHLDPRSYYPEDFSPPSAEHLIGIPMVVGKQQGILTLARYSPHPFCEEEVATVLLFARFVHLGLLNNELWSSLQRSEAQYRSLLEWLPIPLILHRAGRIVYANHTAAQYLGVQSPEELYGLSPLELVAPEDRPGALERIQALYRGELSIAPPRHTRLLRRDGSRIEAIVTATLVTHDNSPTVLTTGIDITELRRLQHQREREQAAFRIIATAALQSNTVSDLCQYFLTEACRELGFAGGSVRLLEGELLVPVALAGPFPPERFPTVSLTDERVLAAHVARTREPIFSPDVAHYPFSEPHRKRLLETGMRAVLSYPILGEGGALLGTFQLFHPSPLELSEDMRGFFTILATSLGVALERLRFREQLQESERRFRMLAEHAPVAITRFNLRQRRYAFANREFERQSGYTLEEFEALSDQELIEMIHPDDRQPIFRFWREWEAAGFPGVQRIDYRIFNRHGELVWLDTYLYAERDPEGHIESIVQICVDITPLKHAEEALQRALQEDFRRTVQNLHALVFRLQRRADGSIGYLLREGKLAGSLTTAAVARRPLDELPDELRFPEELLERAFSGERLSYEAQQHGRWILYTLEPLPADDGTVSEVVGTGIDISQRKELEHSLAESEARYRSLLESLPVGILETFVDEEGKGHELYANPAFAEATGYTLEELTAISSTEAIHPDDRERVFRRWREWLHNPAEPQINLEYRFVRKTGQTMWLHLYAIKLRQSGGWRTIQAGFDVTAQKHAEERLRYLADFPQLSPIPIVELTAEGQLCYANPAAQHSFPVEELSPTSPHAASLWQKFREIQQAEGRTFVHEFELGEQVWLCHVFWLPEHQRVRIYAPEITAQHFLRRQLQEALERERELAAMRARFLGTVAHELRTPLAGIQLSVELLQRYFERLSPSERQQELANITSRVHDLNVLLTDFLTQSSLEALRRSLAFEVISLPAICREAAERIQPLLQSKEQRFELQLPPSDILIHGDPKALRFVLLNLLTNASKYSGSGRPIAVRLQAEMGTARLEIEDHGIGIPEEELPKLFQPFFRASNTQGIPGVGLGLAIVKEFVELHRGTIQVRSSLGVGTTVTLLFPVAETS